MRTCTICNTGKPESDFYRRKSQRNGKLYYSTYCKPCERQKAKKHKKDRYHDPKTREHVKALSDVRTKDPEYRKEQNRRFREKYANDPEFRQSIIDKQRENREDPVKHAKIRKRAADYYQKNKQEIYRKSRLKDKRDPRRRLRGFMRSRINEALKQQGKSKSGAPSLTYLDYTWEKLRDHLESQFEDWMCWRNYGAYDPNRRTWQVDHIIPQAFFPYDSMDCNLFRWCWNLKNLRPLEAHRNFTEGDREYLLGPVRNIKDILIEVRTNSNIIVREPPEVIIKRAQRITPVKESCPMSMLGLSYLDSVFTVRFNTRNTKFPSVNEVMHDDWKVIQSIIYLIKKDHRITPASVTGNLRYVVRTPGHFFPMAALSIIKRYLSSGVMFDPFLGWGGRMIGALCSDITKLVGCDLQSDVVESCRTVAKDFDSLSNVKCEFHHRDSLQFLQATSDKFGLIFTSPPYMDIEDYGIESDSMRQDWLDNFIFPFMEECARHLTEDGKLALHLKDIKGAPTFTAYHAAARAVGFKQIARHKYSRTWTQAVYVYSL
jgi:16S rRNA G966 N2-methylase RsmD